MKLLLDFLIVYVIIGFTLAIIIAYYMSTDLIKNVVGKDIPMTLQWICILVCITIWPIILAKIAVKRNNGRTVDEDIEILRSAIDECEKQEGDP